MGGESSQMLKVANATEDNLEVKVEYSGYSSIHQVHPRGYIEMKTVCAPAPDSPVFVKVKLRVPSAVHPNQMYWIKRTVLYNQSVLIKKREADYVMYQSAKGDMWAIDEKELVNKTIGF